MGFINQCTQLLRAAVIVLWSERQHAVVAPVTLAWELPQGHQFDGSYAQLSQPRQLPGDAGVAVQQADVHLLDNCFMPGPALPRVQPGYAARSTSWLGPCTPSG